MNSLHFKKCNAGGFFTVKIKSSAMLISWKLAKLYFLNEGT